MHYVGPLPEERGDLFHNGRKSLPVDVAHCEDCDAGLPHQDLLAWVKVAAANKADICRINLSSLEIQVCKLRDSNPRGRRQTLAVHVSARRRLGRVEVAVRVDVENADPLAVFRGSGKTCERA